MALAKNIPKRSEKAKSEFVVLPILVELIKKNIDFITTKIQANDETGISTAQMETLTWAEVFKDEYHL